MSSIISGLTKNVLKYLGINICLFTVHSRRSSSNSKTRECDFSVTKILESRTLSIMVLWEKIIVLWEKIMSLKTGTLNQITISWNKYYYLQEQIKEIKKISKTYPPTPCKLLFSRDMRTFFGLDVFYYRGRGFCNRKMYTEKVISFLAFMLFVFLGIAGIVDKE